jgi:hypothetical protein
MEVTDVRDGNARDWTMFTVILGALAGFAAVGCRWVLSETKAQPETMSVPARDEGDPSRTAA